MRTKPMIIRAFVEGFLALKIPKLWGVILLCAAATAVVYGVLFAGLSWLLANTQITDLPWLETLADWGARFSALALATLLFPGIVSAVVGIFLDDIAALIEAERYPALGPGRDIPMMESLGTGLSLALWTLGLNLVFLPLYLVLFFIPPLNLVLYYAINGRLLGREYFETVALRRTSPEAVKALRTRHRGTIWLAGALTAALLTVPIVNLFAAVIGVAAMVHIFHKLTGPA
ncbi:MAG: EI24 domain-containing protein [Rhodobacteraceae bacterium]|nr:EI24 domain-containing protein [Paracoccaceae bacterium]